MKKILIIISIVLIVVGSCLIETNEDLGCALFLLGVLTLIFGPLCLNIAKKDKSNKENIKKLEDDGWIVKNKNFYINEKLKKVMINQKELNFDDILKVELILDGDTISKTDTGSAIAKTALFGSIIGGTTAKRKNISYCNDLRIKITTKNIYEPVQYITFIYGFKVRKNNIIYKDNLDKANECLSILEIIINQNNK